MTKSARKGEVMMKELKVSNRWSDWGWTLKVLCNKE